MSRVSVFCLLTLDDFFFFGPLRISGVVAFSSVELSRCHFGSALGIALSEQKDVFVFDAWVLPFLM